MSPLDRVRAALAAHHREPELKFFAQHLPTAPIAAEATGVELGRIAKSILLFAGKEPVLVVAAGDRRVDRQKVKLLTGGAKVKIASAVEVLETTGFVAGGVAPVGLLHPAAVLLDESLQRFPDIWAGGGVPEALLRLPVADLPLLTGGTFADVTCD
ncbi:MAG TPA: YbaK/EbsC family protein [Symbiobacteriaceae bacterium]|nr:YbaK/EbsC family protein [Symbiobacteriaceae bacterium]